MGVGGHCVGADNEGEGDILLVWELRFMRRVGLLMFEGLRWGR